MKRKRSNQVDSFQLILHLQTINKANQKIVHNVVLTSTKCLTNLQIKFNRMQNQRFIKKYILERPLKNSQTNDNLRKQNSKSALNIIMQYGG